MTLLGGASVNGLGYYNSSFTGVTDIGIAGKQFVNVALDLNNNIYAVTSIDFLFNSSANKKDNIVNTNTVSGIFPMAVTSNSQKDFLLFGDFPTVWNQPTSSYYNVDYGNVMMTINNSPFSISILNSITWP